VSEGTETRLEGIETRARNEFLGSHGPSDTEGFTGAGNRNLFTHTVKMVVAQMCDTKSFVSQKSQKMRDKHALYGTGDQGKHHARCHR